MVTTSYPYAGDPIAGVFVRSLARALRDRGATIEVLAPEPARGASVSEPGIDVHPIPYVRPRALSQTFYGAGVPDNVRGRPSAWLGLATFPLALAAALRQRAHTWDAVVTHWALPSALAVAEVAGGLPHVAFLHSADVHLLERLPLGRALAVRIARSTTAIAAASADLRTRFLALAPDAPVSVRPIGTDEPPVSTDEHRSARARLGVSGTVALSLARHVPVKGLDVAIDAAAPRTTLVLAGDGPEHARLRGRAAASGARVLFPGTVVNGTRRAWLAAADLVLVPSRVLPSGRTEGTPTLVLEALAAGVPVVASDVGGIADVVRDGENGQLVPPGDRAALASVLESLDDVRLARLAAGARRTPVPRPEDAARFVLERLAIRAR